MHSKAKTVPEYLKSLPEDRRKAIKEARKVMKAHLPKGMKEVMQYGMISYVVPLSKYPAGYLNDGKTPLPYASLANQKNYMAAYLFCIYTDKKGKDWFQKEYKKTGKKMDMGKSCVRFKKLENMPLELLGKAVGRFSVEEFIKTYEQARANA